MRGSVTRRALSGAIGVLLLLVSSSCATSSAAPGALPVPTFSAPPAGGGAAPGAAPGEKGLPGECERILGVDALGALLGLPLDSVAVRTVVGVPAPSVGRDERLDCRYIAATSVGDRRRGAALLDIALGSYVDADAAARQWRVNSEAMDGPSRELALGAASAVLVERSGEAMLLVVNDAETVTLVLPADVRVGERTSEETLVDLALRVLGALSGTAPAADPSTPSVVTEAAR
jgi:hypothetical protein